MRLSPALLLLVLALAACGARGDKEGATASEPSPVSVAAAPPLRGRTTEGADFSLKAFRGKPVVLVFYRGAYCTICRRRLQALTAHADGYADLGAELFAVTPDPPDLARRSADALDLDFPVISVPRATLERWGLWRRGERAPRPGAFIIEETGSIGFRHVGRTAADRVSDVTLLGQLRRAAPRSAGEP